MEPNLRAVEAPLEAHGASNFFTGLAGGDVITSGGLFVATYQVPEVGDQLLLKISMPGGFQFVAKAVVAWTRENGAAPTDLESGTESAAMPGFGARFSEISEAGRKLVLRYVNNRQPLFHEEA